MTASAARSSWVTAEPIDEAAIEAACAHSGAGGVVAFRGVVRDLDDGRTVTGLEYQGHPSASTVLAAVVEEFAARPDVLGVAAAHRVGSLAVGDPALVAVVACAHRREAFTICAELVDEIKHRLPIWKRQVFADGTDEWVNCP